VSPRFAQKNASKSALNCLWEAAQSKPGVSVQISGTTSAKAGEQGIKKPKCLEFGTT